MSSPFIGEVRLVGFNFAPLNWAYCNGQQIAISQNDALFNLIGTTYGGDGQQTFNLPNLMGRVPVHQGSNGVTGYAMGQIGGAEAVTINGNQYPAHAHTLSASPNIGGSTSPSKNVLGPLNNAFSAVPPTGAAAMNSAVLTEFPGGNSPHENRQPYVAMNWVVALYGIYPTQN